MITFKQFLEEDLTKIHHNDAARFYMMHCKDWVDVDKPLWRLTPGDKPIRVREPRNRKDTRQERKYMQKWIFSQPGWSEFPDRMKSIFCSTTRKFLVGDEGDDGTAYAIYPVDGVKMAVTSRDPDFNFIAPFKSEALKDLGAGGVPYILMHIAGTIRGISATPVKPEALFNEIKDRLAPDGKIDRSSKEWNLLNSREQKRFEAFLDEIPEVFTPEGMGCKLVNPATVPLDGKQHEVWFSGKYLSVPSQSFSMFAAAVEKLQNGEELPDVPPKRVVKRAPQK